MFLAWMPQAHLVQPPPMPYRRIAPPASLPGRQETIQDGKVSFVLYRPEESGVTPDGTLTIHFHGATWFAIEEHLRRGLAGPLIVFNNGQGSSVYREPFLDRGRLSRWVQTVEEKLGTRVRRVDLSSFSAGYGAIREIVKSPKYVSLVHRIVLADSMYAGYEPVFAGARSRRPAKADLDPWLPFAKLAAHGGKEFVLTYSQVPTGSYASSSTCARWLAQAVGTPTEVLPPTGDPRFPLIERADLGRFHLWGYGGSDADAHTTHARHIADVWRALDAAPTRYNPTFN